MAGKAKTTQKGKGTVGRPTDYTPELGDLICDMLAEGMSLRKVCSNNNMPDKSTVFRWLRSDPEFRDQYARAKEEAADALVEEMLDIADDASQDFQIVKSKKGNEYPVMNAEFAARSRLRVDTRKWIASKLKPKRYGDKLDITGEQTHNHRFKDLDDEQLDEAIKAAKDSIA